jgi:hypothetical protein
MFNAIRITNRHPIHKHSRMLELPCGTTENQVNIPGLLWGAVGDLNAMSIEIVEKEAVKVDLC